MRPHIEIGILFSPSIRFHLHGEFIEKNSGKTYRGEYTVCKRQEKIIFRQEKKEEVILSGFTLIPADYTSSHFELLDVIIGIHFHWERKENQKFKGSLKIIDEKKHLTAINILPLEDYLVSVISSEMSATSSLELLKAHAVISRSWLLAQKAKSFRRTANPSRVQTETEYIRWYDREDHLHFDVCADDHCQRYQGISKAYTPIVSQAVEATQGEILTYEGEVCDTRFSKCCGGVSELFENTWEPVNHAYLTKVIDTPVQTSTPDLRQEEEARKWILSSPDVFCNTRDKAILSNVLNDYDQETRNFFRWEVYYETTELSELVKSKLGIDFGRIVEIQPIERGVSGRLVKVKIVGTLKSMIIGKELVIRKAFSASHLYSSAFVVDSRKDSRNNTIGFTFKGAGWGHGVGLCQIGAAVMSEKGYNYREILAHYFPGTDLEKIDHE